MLARDESARARRREILLIPFGLTSLSACLGAAARLVEMCSAEATAATELVDAREKAALEEALGFGTRGARPRQAAAAVKELDEQQKARAKRFQRDAIDRALTELTGFYRDLLSLQTHSGAALVNDELAPAAGDAGPPLDARVHPAPHRRAARLPHRAGGQRRAAARAGVDDDRARRGLTGDRLRPLGSPGRVRGGLTAARSWPPRLVRAAVRRT